MKDDTLEKATAEFLRMAFSCPVVRHPRGDNNTPDILLSNSTAVEVTRLKKQVVHEGEEHSLETREPEIRDSFTDVVAKAKNKIIHGQSYFVSATASLPHYNNIKHGKAIKLALSEICPLSPGQIEHIQIDDFVTLSVMLSSRVFETTFRAGAVNLIESAGWVLEELIDQTQWALDHKISKISTIHTEYSEWWLAVGNHLTFSLDDEDVDFVSQHLEGRNIWSKVILVDQLNLHQSKIIDLKT